MKGNEEMLFVYMEGASKSFKIPVYQRNYDWKIEHCENLYDDLVKVYKENRDTHFFGSLVSAREEGEGSQDFIIIDGQQRLTTISLMLLALHNLMVEGKIEYKDKLLPIRIRDEYLINKYDSESTRIKLKPVKYDARAYKSLVDNDEDLIKNSNITINYEYFYNRIQKGELTADELFAAFCKLQVIDIFLHPGDNPQLIFESLNSTGLDLSEGDKIRNYVLMDVRPTSLQEEFYENYWHKIENATNYDVSSFIRDYLSIKMQSTPTMSKVYLKFKDYMYVEKHKNHIDYYSLEGRKDLLEDLLIYSRRYEKLLKANTKNKDLNLVINNLNRFQATVTRPFLMEVLTYFDKGIISEKDLVEIFKIVENYLLRRQICDIPTNSLNKTFLTLNREILEYDQTTDNYLEKLKYNLKTKKGRRIYPDDDMFADGITNKQVYLMRTNYKNYILEKLENFDTKEVRDIWSLIDEGVYTIEHIMPQTLTNAWKDELGQNYKQLHETWLNKLANITLTAYNSKYSNRTFLEKKNIKNGFLDSGIRMNQQIAQYDKWTENELIDRNDYLIEKAKEIWPMVDTKYEPVGESLEYFTLDDDISMKGRQLVKFNLKGDEFYVNIWKEAFLIIVSTLHSLNPIILYDIAEDDGNYALSSYISDSEEGNTKYTKLEEGLYIYTNCNTDTKLNILRHIFELYGLDKEELVFYLKNQDKE